MRTTAPVLAVMLSISACGEEPPAATDGGGRADASVDAASRDAPIDDDATTADDAAIDDAGDYDASTVDGGPAADACDWIRAHFEGAPEVTGTITRRTTVETPAFVHDADACCGKYAFDVHEDAAPDDRRVGFCDVTIHDLVSSDAFGGGIQTSSAAGVTLFLANVVVDPGWPTWVSYAETNYDGIVLDGSAAIYAEDLTIRNWNADGAIDNKAPISQLVRLTIEGRGHRGIRYWGAGPHYLVESRVDNDGTLGEGSLLWFRDCSTVELRVYDSTFDGSDTVPADRISCDEGRDPTIVYLDVDPRTTGEMHEMFGR